jgi:hypothetical protein
LRSNIRPVIVTLDLEAESATPPDKKTVETASSPISEGMPDSIQPNVRPDAILSPVDGQIKRAPVRKAAGRSIGVEDVVEVDKEGFSNQLQAQQPVETKLRPSGPLRTAQDTPDVEADAAGVYKRKRALQPNFNLYIKGDLPASRAADPGPPPIQVTIGRIEIRATAAPAATAAQKPRLKAPVMSLDEYLRQRNNGGNQ